MSRLESALQRLYQMPQAEPPGLIDPQSCVRAMVLELARPADWAALAPVWHGVQSDLRLPAPAIAVSGVDGFQLWFSLAEPTPVRQAVEFMAALCQRYLRPIPSGRIRCLPMLDASGAVLHAPLVPARQGEQDHWSAFVAPDLAPMFADEPWLDLPPGPEGQADLLAPLNSIRPAELAQAIGRLSTLPSGEAAQVSTDRAQAAASAKATATWPSQAPDPRQFLLDVMQDNRIDMALRIEAAKALLPYTEPGTPSSR